MTKTVNFTKAIFQILHMQWTEKAKARDLLSGIIVEEETLGTILEDVVFSMTEFMDLIREEHGVSTNDSSAKVVSYIVKNDEHYSVHVGNDMDSKVAFMIKSCSQGHYRLEKPRPHDCIQVVNLKGMEELKSAILFWFNEFYRHIDETMR
jgi:hypothetical protein